MWKMQDLNKSEIGRSTISEKVRNPKKVGNQFQWEIGKRRIFERVGNQKMQEI